MLPFFLLDLDPLREEAGIVLDLVPLEELAFVDVDAVAPAFEGVFQTVGRDLAVAALSGLGVEDQLPERTLGEGWVLLGELFHCQEGRDVTLSAGAHAVGAWASVALLGRAGGDSYV